MCCVTEGPNEEEKGRQTDIFIKKKNSKQDREEAGEQERKVVAGDNDAIEGQEDTAEGEKDILEKVVAQKKRKSKTERQKAALGKQKHLLHAQ